MDAIYPGGGGVDPLAVPSEYPAQESGPGVAAVTLEVDGELFAVRPDEHGGTSYTWLTGPNSGYGFSASPTRDWSAEAHRENIRSFLEQIDPSTGYIEDD
jgi:hypothetical protein